MCWLANTAHRGAAGALRHDYLLLLTLNCCARLFPSLWAVVSTQCLCKGTLHVIPTNSNPSVAYIFLSTYLVACLSPDMVIGQVPAGRLFWVSSTEISWGMSYLLLLAGQCQAQWWTHRTAVPPVNHISSTQDYALENGFFPCCCFNFFLLNISCKCLFAWIAFEVFFWPLIPAGVCCRIPSLQRHHPQRHQGWEHRHCRGLHN